MTLQDYRSLIAGKRIAYEPRGFKGIDEDKMPGWMFDHQRHGTAFALRCGSAALFYDTGLGKTGMALAWGDEVVRRTNLPVLMLAPLAVAAQHVAEAEKFGISATQSRTGAAPVDPRIVVTNYERLELVNPELWGGVILDESSILKSFTGKTTRKLIEAFKRTPYRLAATATPAPNDHTELGQHSQFLGVMDAPEMLSRWFIADQQQMGHYRLKRPAVRPYWDWVASWARCVSKPSDLGYSDDGFEMPPLNLHRHLVKADRRVDAGEEKDGQIHLFRMPDMSATSIHKEKRLTTQARAAKLAELVAAEPNEAWVIWVDTDYDADAVLQAIPDAVEVRGSMPIEKKEERLQAFSSGEIKILLTKPSIAGFGLNWQHCARQAFMGLSFSYESFYQAVRRCWRFRQQRAVDVHVVCADTEEAIWHVINRKAGDHDTMKAEMAAAMARVARSSKVLQTYSPPSGGAASRVALMTKVLNQVDGDGWSIFNADTVEFTAKMPDNSVDLTVYSPPFSSLYIYSESERDMGNVSSHEEFFASYRHLIREKLRITKPGRNSCIHIKDLVYYSNSSDRGDRGLYSFTGECIRAHVEEGWTYHRLITVWRDPVKEMQKTKADRLLYKHFRQDAARSGGGLPEYIAVFRKWGEGMEDTSPIVHNPDQFPLEIWQEWASPVWMHTRETDVLNVGAKTDEERHLCPMPLDLIQRCILLWSNPGETIYSPFTGIGSEGYEAVRHGRRFIGTELSPKYFKQAAQNLRFAEKNKATGDLLEAVPEVAAE